MDLAIHNVNLDHNQGIVNIDITDGKFVKVSNENVPNGERTIDAGGFIVTPPFFESHFYLDNSLLYGGINSSGSLKETIEYLRIHLRGDRYTFHSELRD